ncbi:MAG: hypothetical protein M0Z33_08600 [Actinomycetota bacterium]|nr:hypothetical protein [Actinomycetota bacterium]
MAAVSIAVRPGSFRPSPEPWDHRPARPRVATTGGRAARLRLVGHDAAPSGGTTRPLARSRPGRARRALPGLLTVGVLTAVWFGAGALRDAGVGPLVPPPGARATATGYVYVARPGDTVWSLASEMEPGSDPRPLVDAIVAQLPGGVLRVGEVVHLP